MRDTYGGAPSCGAFCLALYIQLHFLDFIIDSRIPKILTQNTSFAGTECRSTMPAHVH